ncbi:hypothetical protein B0H13DRAFT_2368511 [Mycena leptocephala]|nr:hypothetical protein B0H13DRAFT_2368511 [Mycena leptocephala]
MEHGALHAVMVIIAICALVHPSNTPAPPFLLFQVQLSFVDLAIALHHPGQSSLDTTSNPRPLAQTPSLIPLLLLTFALFAVPLLHVVAYVITPPRFLPCTALPILSHLPVYPPA